MLNGQHFCRMTIPNSYSINKKAISAVEDGCF
jgi:hypothetical protein